MTAKTVPAPDITKQVNDLLRDEPRLLAAAPLIDRVSVVLKLAPRKVKPPPPLAWLKVAKLSILSPAQRAEQARLGGEAEAQITVDEALWSRLDATGRRAALVLALRGLYEETVGDEDPQEVTRKAPAPYQTWADTAAELSELVAAFREDAAAAALESDAAERLGVLPLYNLIRDLRRAFEDQTKLSLTDYSANLSRRAAAALGELAADLDPEEGKPVASGRHGDVHFVAEGDDRDEICSYEIGWGHGDRKDFETDAEWSAHGFGLYEGGDLHDGHRSVREVLETFADGVYLSLEDYKAGRKITIEAVVDAARAWANLPPIAECDETWIAGEGNEPLEGAS